LVIAAYGKCGSFFRIGHANGVAGFVSFFHPVARNAAHPRNANSSTAGRRSAYLLRGRSRRIQPRLYPTGTQKVEGGAAIGYDIMKSPLISSIAGRLVKNDEMQDA